MNGQHLLPTRLSRRSVLAGGVAVLATLGQGQAQTGGWNGAIDKARSFEQMRALVVAQNGETVISEAVHGPAVSRPVNVKSVSKTIVAALTGAALDRGEIASLDVTLSEIAPHLLPADADPRAGDITVGDLVTLRAGLERTSGGNYGEWVSSSDWVANALARPFVDRPGGRMLYSTGSFHILGAVLSEASGQSLLSLARERLGDPLGIDIPPWTRDPQGRYLGGNEMALSPDGMVRFGEMYRRSGIWRGARVLSETWVDQSFEPRTRSPFSGLDYGYGWFLGRIQGHEMALARGYGGQIICVLPDLGLTVAITSDPTQPARSEGYFGDLVAFIGNEIVPAAS